MKNNESYEIIYCSNNPIFVVSFFDSKNIKHTMQFDNHDKALKYLAQLLEFGFADAVLKTHA